MKKEDYSKYELPKDISPSLRSKFDEFPSNIIFTLESITEQEFLNVSHGLGNTLPKFKTGKVTVYLVDNGHHYRARLTYSDDDEAVHQACESLIGYAPSAHSLQTKKSANGDQRKKDKVPHRGRREGRRPAYLLGK